MTQQGLKIKVTQLVFETALHATLSKSIVMTAELAKEVGVTFLGHLLPSKAFTALFQCVLTLGYPLVSRGTIWVV